MTYRQLLFCIGAFLASFLLASCSSGSAKREEAKTLIAPGLGFELPQWTAPDRPVEAAQVLSGRFGDKRFSLQVRLSLSDQRLKVVGIDALGRRVVDILWSESGVTATRAPWAPENTTAENVLADIVIAFWPQSSVESALRGDEVAVRDAPGRRTLSVNAREAILISYSTERRHAWNQEVRLSNLAFDYELTIRSTEVTP